MAYNQFNELTAAQVAGYFLQKAGGTMHHIKLIKLMYLAERESFQLYGRPITYDDFYNLPNGPILSNTLNLLKNEIGSDVFQRFFSPIRKNVVQLKQEPGLGNICAAELNILDSVFATFGNMNRWDLVKYTHTLPEWKDPGISRLPLAYADVMDALDFSEEEIQESLDYMTEWAN